MRLFFVELLVSDKDVDLDSLLHIYRKLPIDESSINPYSINENLFFLIKIITELCPLNSIKPEIKNNTLDFSSTTHVKRIFCYQNIVIKIYFEELYKKNK